MKPDDLKHALMPIQPTSGEKDRMEENILRSAEKEPSRPRKHVWTRAAAIAASLVMLAGIGTAFAYFSGMFPVTANSPSGVSDGDMALERDIATPAAWLEVDGKQYIPISDETRAAFGLPEEIKQEDLEEWMEVTGFMPPEPSEENKQRVFTESENGAEPQIWAIRYLPEEIELEPIKTEIEGGTVIYYLSEEFKEEIRPVKWIEYTPVLFESSEEDNSEPSNEGYPFEYEITQSGIVKVYRYLPAGCDAVIAVEKNGEISLFQFSSFISYMENRDEDFIAYLELYGIHNADDIKEVQLLHYSEDMKVNGTNPLIVDTNLVSEEELSAFYERFSVLKESSSKYWALLYAQNQPTAPSSSLPTPKPSYTEDLPTDYGEVYEALPTDYEMYEELPPDRVYTYEIDPVQPQTSATPFSPLPTPSPSYSEDFPPDYGGEGGSYSGSTGDALDNVLYLRVIGRNGLYFEMPYYPNIRFLSRYELSEEIFNTPLDGLGKFMLK